MTEAQKEYIITEKQLVWYEGLITSEQSERYAKEIRSRQYKSDAVLDRVIDLLEDEDFCPRKEDKCSSLDEPYPCAICIVNYVKDEFRQQQKER